MRYGERESLGLGLKSSPKPVCDFQEIYRCFIDGFLVQYCQNLRGKDFTVKTEKLSRDKKAKKEYFGVQT